jgi:DNA-directed RNA polymerase subunit H (RpoH/RPB5)
LRYLYTEPILILEMASGLEEKTNSFNYKLVESRAVILEMMEARGYNTTPYSRINPKDLVQLSINPEALGMILYHKDDETRRASIVYSERNIKNSLTGVIEKAIQEVEEDRMTKESEIIYIMMKDAVKDTFHEMAVKAWTKAKLRIQFFEMNDLVSNPLKHFLQPKFEVVPEESYNDLLKTLYIRNKSQFPIMKYHVDMVARFMGLLPGTIVKITRPSPNAGLYESYRVVAL